jgi:hypothetical protein
MYSGDGRSLGTDYFLIADQLTREELGYLRRTRDLVDGEVLAAARPSTADNHHRDEGHAPPGPTRLTVHSSTDAHEELLAGVDGPRGNVRDMAGVAGMPNWRDMELACRRSAGWARPV